MDEIREQWCVRVRKTGAEQVRQDLRSRGLLDPSLRPRKEGEWVLFPVREACEGAVREEFEALAPPPDLPRHEMIGGIAVLPEPDPDGAKRLLASRPSLHTALYPLGDVEGEYRTRRFMVLAGKDTTETICREHGLAFSIDLAVAYFSPRLSTERQRVLALAGPGERVLDMFAGVGPFALTLAGKASLVVACDLNPGAIRLLVGNIHRNHGRNVLPVFSDAARLPALLPWTFDRIVMNLPLGAFRFLRHAFSLSHPGTTIHLYALQEEEGQFLPAIRDALPAREVTERFVRSYSPGRWHAVYDVVVGE
ncbi:MAG: class I SAM-dependent methyltransferase family protein [Methanolinea sp.]|nr:class I SAM-dependent methyltransferase family protein [Methanolinea sp.]